MRLWSALWPGFAVAAAVFAGANAAPAHADTMPNLDIDPSCRAAASRSTSTNYLEVCRATEQKARDELVQLWPRLTSADKSECLPLVRLGGKPTYTELLTCLEMSHDVRTMRARGGATTTGESMR